jgi:hypothetical protein
MTISTILCRQALSILLMYNSIRIFISCSTTEDDVTLFDWLHALEYHFLTSTEGEGTKKICPETPYK